MKPPGAPHCVLVCALGGEGGGVLAEWLYQAAVRAGHAAQATSIPGVAQRTGATTYYIEVARAAGEMPVFGLSPVPGSVDLLVSTELLETLRQANAGMVSVERTRVISSTARALTVAEKMGLGDGRVDMARAHEALARYAAALHLFDFSAWATEAGTAPSAVLLGAIAASGVLPLPRMAYEDAIRAAGKGVAASLRGFALAFERVQAGMVASEVAAMPVAAKAPMAPAPVAPAAPAAPAGSLSPATPTTQAGQAETAAPAAPVASTAPPTPDFAALGRARVLEYQDERYAALYDERLTRLRAIEGGSAVAAEAARWLALWMCFDDIVQVAGRKLAARRIERVRREAGAAPGEVLKIYDHFKPGTAEIAALLPATLATRLAAWDRRRVAAGREPWSLAIRLPSHSLIGVLALRLLAALKGQRRRGQRFAQEQQLIERWLAAVLAATRESAELGLELARAARLVKGYGSTNERGKANLLHIVEHLAAASGKSTGERIAAVRAAREAALADEGGHALDRTLQAHGAPARPLREQPVRWFKRRPDAAGAGTAPS